MNRLQQKCAVAAAGFHLLLILILFIGPAFLSSRSQPDDLQIIDFVPVKTVDALVSGGGNPNAKPPPAAPVAPPQPAPPAPQPAAEKKAPPEPAAKEPVKEVKPDTESPEVSNGRKHPIEISTKLVKRGPDAATKARADAAAKAAADERRRAAAAIGRAVAGIEGDLSGSTTIELKGPGGGGVPYANWLQAVKSIYANAWVLPDGVTDDSATTTASVAIARDGMVISATITHSSGNAAVDQSVQAALNRVRHAAPLPDDAKEGERTVTINFNVKAKRALG